MAAKGRKIVWMSFLTLCAGRACYWQYNRYHESTARWETIFSQIRNYSPIPIESYPLILRLQLNSIRPSSLAVPADQNQRHPLRRSYLCPKDPRIQIRLFIV
jgi:hypothetical protein